MQFCEYDIFISDECFDKVIVLYCVVEKLFVVGNIMIDYLCGMLDCEVQIFIYLGNGIVILYGMLEFCDVVL